MKKSRKSELGMNRNTNEGFDHFDYLTVYDNFWEFLRNTEERIFRFWVYKRMFTPLEQEKKYMDETQYEDTHATVGIIREAIVLPDGDLLLGFAIITDDVADTTDEYRHLDYYKLSEIRLAHYPRDFKEYNYGT